MKRLILIRHAKSSWSNGGLPDKDRPLNDRGREASAQMGKWLDRENLLPDEVLSSSATRCRQTWDGLANAANLAVTPRFEDRLYLAGPAEMLAILSTATGDTVLILGHMPGISEFARDLRRDPPPAHEMFQKYPTGAATVLDFRTAHWREAQMGTGIFVSYMTPKELA